MTDTDLTKALRSGDIRTLEALGCTISPAHMGTPAVEEARTWPRAKARSMVEPGVALVEGRLVILVAVETASEANGRDWKARSRRSGKAWKAVRQALGPHLGLLDPFAAAYAQGRALKLKFVRMGGRPLDGLANLGTAVKGVEDALAYLLNANDGDRKLWFARADQETGGAVGVRIELELLT